ncbi:hypothetical protein G9A89_004339 [Geosiphon pyriformis]|nr:hypothetical protein G9A89_004339 [Geosiphon pyriformis]
MLRKKLKLKANLPKDFPNEALYYPELYGLKTFEQLLTENLLAGLISFKKLDPKGLVSIWFVFLVEFINKGGLLNDVLLAPHSILADSFCNFGYVDKHLLNSELGSITVYMNSSIKNLGLLGVCSGTATYFPDVNANIGIKVHGLLLSILVELQAIVFALECVSVFHLVL